MQSVVVVAAAVLLLATAVTAYPNYYITASQYVREGSPYVISVAIDDDVASGVQVVAEFSLNETYRNPPVVRVISAAGNTFAPGTKGSLTLDIPEGLERSAYTLKITGSEGLDFVNVSSVYISSEPRDVLIQLDKGLYKPRDTVRFRVVAVEPDLTPYTGKISVNVKDPKNNQIRQWRDLKSDFGVVSLDMPLSDQPNLGSWSIEAQLLNEDDKVVDTGFRNFDVNEYVLPKWSVTLTAPDYIVRSKKSSIQGVVQAEYTYGEPVRGTLVVKVRNPRVNTYTPPGCVPIVVDPEANVLTSKTYTGFNGERDFNVEFVISERYLYGVQVEAFVTDELTETTRNDTKSVSITDDPFRVSIRGPSVFKPGLVYQATVTVNRQGNEPLRALDSKEVVIGHYIKLPVEAPPPPEGAVPGSPSDGSDVRPVIRRRCLDNNCDNEEFIKKSFTVTDGKVDVQYFIPENAEELRIETFYNGKRRDTQYVSKYKSIQGETVSIVQISSTLSVDNQGEFLINSTDPITAINYVVTNNKNGQVATGEVQNVNGGNEVTLNLNLTPDMAPQSHLLVYYTKNGEVIADSLRISVDGIFQNEVSIEFSKAREEPGNLIVLTVNTKPDSFVAIAAIDQSLLLLNDQNDITQEQIVPGQQQLFGGGYTRHALGEFSDANLIIFTDAVVYNGVDIVPVNNNCPRIQSFAAKSGPNRLSSAARESADFDSDAVPVGASPPPSLRAVRVRRFFPETWLWQNTTVGETGISDIIAVVPDTITSYVTSAFSINKLLGIAIAGDKAKLEVFRSFFVIMRLPYSVVRDEHVEIQVLVFNYLDDDISGTLTLDRSDDFESIFSPEEIVSAPQTVNFAITAGEAENIKFYIRPTKVGNLRLKVSADAGTAADAVVRTLLVKPEGVTKYENEAQLVEIEDGGSYATAYSAPIPADLAIVPDSERVEIKVTGDLMGQTLTGLSRLLLLPIGCGEQNLVRLAPNVYVLNYLTATAQLTDEVAENALDFIRTGYQRQLSYQRNDGSFSAFGENDESGSVWLTAFTLKTLHEAKPYLNVDDDEVLIRAASWLISKHREGKFEEVGRIIRQDIQGGSGNGVSLTAYVLIAFMEAEELTNSVLGLEQAIQASRTYLESVAETLQDPYEIAIVTYALVLARSEAVPNMIDKLLDAATVEDAGKYWKGSDDEDEFVGYYGRRYASSQDIEATAYAMLALVENRDSELIAENVAALKWLAQQRNAFGGYRSSQDTVLGLQALTAYAARLFNPDLDLTLSVTSGGVFGHDFVVNADNSIVLQSVVVPTSEILDLSVSGTGKGAALLQFATQYNVFEDLSETPAFAVKVEATTTANQKMANINVCVSYNLEGQSNMAVAHITVPSGFKASVEDVAPLADNLVSIQKVEFENDDTEIVLYFNSIDETEQCFDIKADQEFVVEERKPAVVSVVDYYDTSKITTVLYSTNSEEQLNVRTPLQENLGSGSDNGPSEFTG